MDKLPRLNRVSPKLTGLWLALCLALPAGLAARAPASEILYPAPVLLPETTPQMQSAGYWIARHPAPDKLIMDAAQIARFNDRVSRQGGYSRLGDFSGSYSGSLLRGMITDQLELCFALAKYDSTGARVGPETFSALRRNAAVERIPATVKVRFGFPVRLADQRLAPSALNLNKKYLDFEFDELQNSGFDIGTPTVFFHDSADGLWVHGASAVTHGWYRKDQICFLPRQDWLDYQNAKRRAVVYSARADLWADPAATRHIGWCRLGSEFPLVGESGAYYRITIPIRAESGSGAIADAYIAKSDAGEGYLPYTARNVYNLAFKTLNLPYGWGDMRGDFDCSSLMIHIFSCFGINLPRNGRLQAETGTLLHSFAPGETYSQRNAAILRQGRPGISLLRLEGHIMLYLGESGGQAYALHDTWGFRKDNPDREEDDVYVIDKVVVSGLNLGQDSRKGSLGQRLLRMNAIAH